MAMAAICLRKDRGNVGERPFALVVRTRLLEPYWCADVFQRGRILTNASASRAREVASMKRLELQDGGELLHPAELVADDVPGDTGRKG